MAEPYQRDSEESEPAGDWRAAIVRRVSGNLDRDLRCLFRARRLVQRWRKADPDGKNVMLHQLEYALGLREDPFLDG